MGLRSLDLKLHFVLAIYSIVCVEIEERIITQTHIQNDEALRRPKLLNKSILDITHHIRRHY